MHTINFVTGGHSGANLAAHPHRTLAFMRKFAALVLRAAAWPVRVAAARAAMTEFARMSDHDLKDIGLTRQDVRDATSLVLDDDPTRLLAGRAAARTRRLH